MTADQPAPVPDLAAQVGALADEWEADGYSRAPGALRALLADPATPEERT